MSALSGAQHLASSGRTSFPVDKALPRDAYRVLGYRQCGERAVRVDILERLADLIRPALAWRESFARRKADRRVRRPRLCGDAGDDLADGIGRRGFRLDPARARLSHGQAPAVAAEARAGGSGRDGRPLRRRRWKLAAESNVGDAGGRSRRRSAGAAASSMSGDPAPSAALLPERHAGARRERRACGCSRGRAVEAAAEPRRRKPRSRTAPPEQRSRSRTAPPKLRPSPPPRAKLPLKPRRKPLPREAAPPKLLQPKPSPMRRPSLYWSKSGGPAAVPRSAARITTATASAITAARPKARAAAAAPAKAPRARRASSAIAAAAATTSSASPARARRPMPRLLRRRPRARRRRASATGPSAPRALRRQGPRRTTAATSSIATRATATRVAVATRASAAAVISADATRAAATSATAARRTGSGRPAQRRASAIVRSIPIRRLQNWRR